MTVIAAYISGNLGKKNDSEMAVWQILVNEKV